MMVITRKPNNLIINDTVIDHNFGEVHGIIKPVNLTTNECYGFLDYSLINRMLNHTGVQKIFQINMIHVYDKYQRHGYATLMIKHVKTRYRGYEFYLKTTTTDGQRFFKALGIPDRRLPITGAPGAFLKSDKFR
jgi:hypothetical protein